MTLPARHRPLRQRATHLQIAVAAATTLAAALALTTMRVDTKAPESAAVRSWVATPR